MTERPVIEDRTLRNCSRVFADRDDAGRQLARLLQPLLADDALILAIPAGGFPVARVISEQLQRPLDLLVASKLLLPYDSEAGFGGIAFDGSEWLNRALIEHAGLSEDEIDNSRRQAIEKVQRRFRQLCRQQLPDVAGRQVILVDDGLASGATLFAALAALHKLQPRQLIVALPTGCADSVQAVAPLCDVLVCANIRAGYPFAVASAYRHWDDVGDAPLLAWRAQQG